MDFPVIQSLCQKAERITSGGADAPYSPTVLVWEATPQSTKRPVAEEADFLIGEGYAVYRISPTGLKRLEKDPSTGKVEFRSAHSCYTMLAIRRDAVGYFNEPPEGSWRFGNLPSTNELSTKNAIKMINPDLPLSFY